MTALSLFTAAVAPGAALLVYFYLRDRYDSEPISSVLKMFMLGALTVFPTMIVQRGLVLGFGDQPLFFSFGVTAGMEEFVKWFLVYNLIYRNKAIRHSYDGIVYATSVSLGFATLENVLYTLFYQPDIAALLSRALLPVSGHALFAVVMGFYMGKAGYNPARERYNIARSLCIPILWHGTFDYIMLFGKRWMWLIIPFMVLLWTRSLLKMKRASRMPVLPMPAKNKVKMHANGQ